MTENALPAPPFWRVLPKTTSSNVAGMGLDATGTLVVAFRRKSSTVTSNYRYPGLTPEVIAAIFAAERPNMELHARVVSNKKHVFERVTDLPAELAQLAAAQGVELPPPTPGPPPIAFGGAVAVGPGPSLPVATTTLADLVIPIADLVRPEHRIDAAPLEPLEDLPPPPPPPFLGGGS